MLNLRGGTNTDMAPQIDAFTEIFLPNLKHFGTDIEFEVSSISFSFPKPDFLHHQNTHKYNFFFQN